MIWQKTENGEKGLQKGKLALESLGKWDGVIYVAEEENEWDNEDFPQEKKGEDSKVKR